MANKNKNVIISYFSGNGAAEQAAQSLKEWDKAHDDIKLGGLGILTWEDDKVKTRLVGNRASGTGAKWGTILGVAAAILTVPVGFVTGPLVGLAGGALVGTLFHKHLGLTDDDKARLETHLRDGGAAVVVMADDVEVAPTQAELAALGGQVENYVLPEVTVVQIEEFIESATPAPAATGATTDVANNAVVDERTPVAEHDIPTVRGLGRPPVGG